MKIKKAISILPLSLLFAGACGATMLSNSVNTREGATVHAESEMPTATFTHSDMQFVATKDGTQQYAGYVQQTVEGEYMNVDEVVGDEGYAKWEQVNTDNRANTSNERCTAHISSGYLKFNVNVQGATNVKVRFTLRMANYNGGTASEYYSIQVGSKSATQYYPTGTLPVGSGTSYLYWYWANCEIEQDFYLTSGTTTIFLSPGTGGKFTNLDCVYVRLIGDDRPILSSLGTVRLEGEYLDSQNWLTREDMYNAGQKSYLETPSGSLTPATSNSHSIARYASLTPFTLNFSSNAEANFSLSLVMAQYEDDINWNGKIAITLDGDDMPSPTPGIVGGHTEQNQFYYWMSANLGSYSVNAGNHTITILIQGQPNIDCFDFTVTKYNGIGVDEIVNQQPSAAVTGDHYASNVLITDANPTPDRDFHEINGASFTTTRLLFTITDEVEYFEGNFVRVNAACTSNHAVMKVYCGSILLGTQTIALSPVEYSFSLTSGQSGFIQVEITGDGEEELFVKWISAYGYATGNTFSDTTSAGFGNTLNTSLTCANDARTYTQQTWESLETAFEALSPEVKRIIAASPASQTGSNLAQGLARYDFIIAKYAGKDYTNDFIGRTYVAEVVYGSYFSGAKFFAINSNPSLLIVAVCAIIITSLIIATFINKKQSVKK